MLYFGVFKASEMFFFHKRSNIAIEIVFCYPKNGKLWEPKSKHIAKVCIDHITEADFHKTGFGEIIFYH